jgi:Ni,Fe-hydrogenase I cytochrome b subunit
MIAIILRYFLGFQQNLTHTKYIIVELVWLPGFRAHIRTYFFFQPGQPHTSTLRAAGGQKSDDLE